MSSAFRNFIITFCACLIVFGLIGWKVVYPAINEVINTEDTTSEVSGDIDDDTSGDDTGDESTDIIEGDTFTTVIVGKANDGLTASVIYLRINEKTKRFSYCFIPTSVTAGNSVGVNTPIKNLFSTLSGDEIARKVSAITGMKINYYVILGMDELSTIVEVMNGATINIDSQIKYLNPDYIDDVGALESGTEIPDEYYITIGQGNNILNADLVRNIMNYNPYSEGIEFHSKSKLLYETVFTQFFTNSGTNGNRSAVKNLLNDIHDTNITPSVLDSYMDIIFTYDIYTLQKVNYPNDRTEKISMFKQADGTD
ncbi:MAG: hypothetical protein A2Y15_03610 [Clostridiales bacterium GWF2_36_10]|nr:MAG: hypothetical protein A2Y15_03610 [Clostridiales bacterium GWF2_36_10]HAN20288.1 hypothetical protein [Clostridiales bacterium]